MYKGTQLISLSLKKKKLQEKVQTITKDKGAEKWPIQIFLEGKHFRGKSNEFPEESVPWRL